MRKTKLFNALMWLLMAPIISYVLCKVFNLNIGIPIYYGTIIYSSVIIYLIANSIKNIKTYLKRIIKRGG